MKLPLDEERSLWDEQLTTPGPAKASTALHQVVPASDSISFDGERYQYRGLSFTPDEAGVLPSCPLERVKAMVGACLGDPVRQREVARFGKRSWHSRVRPEYAASQALDFAFGHDVPLVIRYVPFVQALFDDDPARADDWTRRLQRAYVQRRTEREFVRQLLLEGGVPLGELFL